MKELIGSGEMRTFVIGLAVVISGGLPGHTVLGWVGPATEKAGGLPVSGIPVANDDCHVQDVMICTGRSIHKSPMMHALNSLTVWYLRSGRRQFRRMEDTLRSLKLDGQQRVGEIFLFQVVENWGSHSSKD